MAFRPLTAPTVTPPPATTTPGGFRPLSTAPAPSVPSIAPSKRPESGLFSRIKTGVAESFAERDKKVAEAKTAAKTGKQTTAEGLFQAMGQTAGLITDTAMVTAKEGVRSVAPAAIPAIKRTISAVADTKPVQKAAEAYTGFKEKHPRLTANVEAAANIGGVFPTAKVTQVAT
ncbi:MAG: hypothetical protein AB7F89_22265, partial [Pirellulaceae bacterium]